MDAIPWIEFRGLSFLGGIGILTALYLVYYVLQAIHAVTWSALAKIPGPAARKFSYIPSAYMSLQGRESHAVRDLHTTYGDVVRVSPEMVSFVAPTSWKEIYGNQGAKKFKKSGYRQLRPGIPDLLTANGVDHARQRAALNRAFSSKALHEQEHYFQDHITLFLKGLDQFCDGRDPVNMVEWFEFLAFDIIGTLAFSSSFHCLQDQAYHPWVRLLRSFFKSTHYVLTARTLGIFAPLVFVFGPVRHLLKGKEHLNRSSEKVQQRLRMPRDEKRNDFWTYISRQNDQKEGSMSVPEMAVNAALIIPAGSDTISTTLCSCLYLLLKNPDTLARLLKELDGEFTSESDLTMTRLAGLPYIRAVIDEALRLCPPIPGDLRREVPPEGAVVCSHYVPGGTIISVYSLAANHNARNFAQPKQFTPERWLTTDEQPEWTKGDHFDVCQPFSVGPRNCIGMSLAYAETKLILARLLFRFDLELMNNDFDIEKQRVYIMWEKPALIVRVSRRLPQR